MKQKIIDSISEKLKQSGADEYACRITDGAVTELYYESGKISMVRTNFNNRFSVKIIKDKRKGTASINSFDPKNVDQAIADAMEAAQSASPDPANCVSEETQQHSYERGVFSADKEGLYTGLKNFLDITAQKYPKISFDSISAEHFLTESTYISSNGAQLTEKRGAYALSSMFMAVDKDQSSSFNSTEAVFEDISAPFISLGGTERTLKETEQQIHTVPFPGKSITDVIVTPACMEDIIASVESNFLSDSVLINKTSLFADKLGKQVAAPQVSVYCKPLDETLVNGYAYTDDGYIAENMPLIENGVLKNFVLSDYAARRTGLPRSKNAGGCYVMKPGDTTLQQMISETENGILLNRFSGGSPGVDGDISGVLKNSFLIRNGRIAEALSETMFSANLAKMLTDIKQISIETQCDGGYRLPWVKIGGISVSGK